MSTSSVSNSKSAARSGLDGLNVSVVVGEVADDPVHRDLAGGVRVVQFDVVTVCAGVRTSVPISWVDPSAAAIAPIVAGARVLVAGAVHRRFFRVGAATQSRTEVVAADVVVTRRARAVRSALDRIAEQIRAV